MTIGFIGGSRQRLRRRTRDLTFAGHTAGLAHPVRRAEWRLNSGPAMPFYVEAISDHGVDWVGGYKGSPGELRCKEQGDFVIEMSAELAALRAGENRLHMTIEDAAGGIEQATVSFAWDPVALPLPLDLSDLTQLGDIQEIGQVVAGRFAVDRARNCIRSLAPVVPDSLLLLGSAHASQEATYRVRFSDFAGVKWLGPSDFFVGFEDKAPPIGIKTGWSSAGMMALNPAGEARCFIAWGDHSGTADEWVVVTEPARRLALAAGVDYAVRHQVIFAAGLDRCRFRIWPAGEAEPETWLCEESDVEAPAGRHCHHAASFGLFQHSGAAIEWSDIRVQALTFP